MLRVGGLMQRYKKHKSKKDDRMAFTVLEDMSTGVEVVFPETFARCGHMLGSERGSNIIADEILPLNQAMEKFARQAVITIQSARVSRSQLDELKNLLYQFHRARPVKLTLLSTAGARRTLSRILT